MQQITQANIGSFQYGSRAVIRTRTPYDANGRVVALIDDRGATTTYTYDLLDRQITMTFQDGSVRSNVYNLAGDLITYTDENGSVLSNTYDCLGRKTAVAIDQAVGVVETSSQSFQYDGLSRLSWCEDKFDFAIYSKVAFAYDSLGRVIEEGQTYVTDARYITHDAWTSLTATDMTYPNARQVTSGYDALYRRNSVNETSGGASIAAWQFFGNRTALVALGNGITCSFMNNAQNRSAVQAGQATPPWGDKTTDQLGYDGSGRLISKRFLPSSSTTALVGFTTSYDPSSNKLFERALHAESRSAQYPSYDSINRMLEYDRGVLASGGGSITTAIMLPGTDSQRTYNLDALGNWKNTAYTPVGGSPTTEIRRHNLVNEITKFAATAVLYDHGNNAASSNPVVAAQGNGNIANDGTRIYAYDALNRLTKVSSTASGTPQVAAYTYDALGRRLLKITSNGGISGTIANATYCYLYDGQQIVEELAGTGTTTTLRQFVWGQYIDELIQLKIPATTTAPPLTAGTYYPLQDLLYRTIATTNSSGAIVEAYDYDAYGNTLMYSGPGTDGQWFTDDDVTTLQPMCEFLFTGRQYDPEVENYFYRARYYRPPLGRFLSRDPIGYLVGMNTYQGIGSNPVSGVDPAGLLRVSFQGGWSQADKDRVQAGFDVVVKRLPTLEKQANDFRDAIVVILRKTKSRASKCCFDHLRDGVDYIWMLLKRMAHGVQLDSNINIDHKGLPDHPDANAVTNTWWDWISLNDTQVARVRWYTDSQEALERTLLHELSHTFGTEDLGYEFNDAHNIGWLAQRDIMQFSPIVVDMAFAKLCLQKIGDTVAVNAVNALMHWN